MPKVMIVMEFKEQPRLREMVAMWAHGQVGSTHEVFHPLDSTNIMGEILPVDFISAEVVDEPPAQRRLTKLDLQEKLGASGREDV